MVSRSLTEPANGERAAPHVCSAQRAQSLYRDCCTRCTRTQAEALHTAAHALHGRCTLLRRCRNRLPCTPAAHPILCPPVQRLLCSGVMCIPVVIDLALAFAGRLFQIIVADCPWWWRARSPKGESKSPKYRRMTTAELCAMPVREVAARDARLFLWAISSMVEDAFKLAGAWGFVVKSGLVWVKPRMVMGYHARAQHELVLICSRGQLPVPPPALRHSSVFYGEPATRDHSAKPHELRRLIDSAYPNVSAKLELFARGPAPVGWETWGDEVTDATPRRVASIL
jgi:N6-adenosine-specific RNA methylase IME4